MKLLKMENWCDECIKDMAKKAIKEHKAFEYMIFWMKEPIGWQKKAKQYLREKLNENHLKEMIR
jgi:hypothetical protein